MTEESITQLLAKWRAGDSEAAEQLLPLVYEELRRIASRQPLARTSNIPTSPVSTTAGARMTVVPIWSWPEGEPGDTLFHVTYVYTRALNYP